MKPGEVYNLARGAGLSPPAAALALSIAYAESGLDAAAVGDVGIQDAKWGPSIGLWQIRSLKAESGTGGTRDATRLTDPTFNAKSMATISGAGSNFKPWSAYTSGAHKPFLQQSGEVMVGADLTGDPLNIVGGVKDGVTAVGGAVADVAGALNPFAVFDGWQNDLLGVGLKIGATVAALVLVVQGVKATVDREPAAAA